MSASKKKMQRREAADSKKVDEAQVKQAAYKKKARLYTVIGVVIVVLVAALLIWNSGIFQRKATAATVGDTEFSVSEMSYFYYGTRYMYTMYGVLDSSKSDAAQIYDTEKGTTWQDFLLEASLTQAQQTQSRYEEALKAGYTDADVAEDVELQIKSIKASAAAGGYGYKTYLANLYGRYMTPAAFERLLTRDLLSTQYYNDIGLDKYDSYTLADLEAYYTEHRDEVDTVTYSYLYVSADTVKAEDGEELTTEEKDKLKAENMAAAKTKAEEILAAYQGGTSLEDLVEEYELTVSDIDHSVVGIESISSVYREQLLKLAKDQAAVVESEGYGYYVVVFHDRSRNDELTADVRHILISAETTTDDDGHIVAPTDEVWAASKAEAEKLLAQFEAGSKTPEAFGELANANSDDTGSNTKGGLYENVAKGGFVAELDQWLFAEEGRKAGDTAVIRHEGDTASTNSYWGYHVIYFQDWADPQWELTARDKLAAEFLADWGEDLAEQYPAALTGAAKNLGK